MVHCGGRSVHCGAFPALLATMLLFALLALLNVHFLPLLLFRLARKSVVGFFHPYWCAARPLAQRRPPSRRRRATATPAAAESGCFGKP